jgi:hypothetical protein
MMTFRRPLESSAGALPSVSHKGTHHQNEPFMNKTLREGKVLCMSQQAEIKGRREMEMEILTLDLDMSFM